MPSRLKIRPSLLLLPGSAETLNVPAIRSLRVLASSISASAKSWDGLCIVAHLRTETDLERLLGFSE